MANLSQSPDLILTNGRVYTVDGENRWVEAVAIAGGRIVAVGSAAAIEALSGPATRVENLGGRMAMPGFVDVHNHILMAGQAALYELQFPPSSSIDEICGHVRAHAEKAEPGQWIVGNQWGADMMTALNTEETLSRLDAASLGHPVFLRDETMHNRWANSEAMRLAGISDDQPDPPLGAFARDPRTGRLTGLLIESGSGMVELAASNDFTPAMARAAISRAVEIANSLGITSFQDAATTLPILEGLASLDRDGSLSAWAVCSLPLIQPTIIFGQTGDALLAVRDQHRTAHVRPDFTKIFLDGVPGAYTAAFHEAYIDNPAYPHGHRGEFLVELPEMVRMVDKSERLGMGLKVHCAGDRAVTLMLDAVEAVRHFRGPTIIRHHIAHPGYVRPADVARFAQLNVVADLCPMIWYPTSFLEGHKAAMGEERATRFWPIADMEKAGVLIAGGSDWPVIPVPNPWHGIEGMVTRQNPSGAFPGVSLWKEQAISLATAIRVYTLNAAIAMGIDSLTGSIEPGKSADLIVLDQDVFSVAPDAIADTKVIRTYFEGRLVHEI